MNKLFKPKAMRRLLLFMALIFPVVYLCGGLFFALNGAHGNELFADVISDSVHQEISTENRMYWNANGSKSSWNIYSASQRIDFVEDSTYLIDSFSSSNVVTRIVVNYWDSSDNHIQQDLLSSSFPVNIPVIGASFALSFGSATDFPLGTSSFVLNIVGTPSYNVNYSDYLFSQPFASKNFISELGKGVISNDNAGFAPMNSLFYTINENVLHFDQNDKLAVFGYGYVYYVVNVLIIYEILILAVKLLMLPLKAVDVFDNEER